MVIFEVKKTELKRSYNGEEISCKVSYEPEIINQDLLDNILLEIVLNNRKTEPTKENVA